MSSYLTFDFTTAFIFTFCSFPFFSLISLRHLSVHKVFRVRVRAQHLVLNPKGDRLGLIDSNGILSLISFRDETSLVGDIVSDNVERPSELAPRVQLLPFQNEKRDCWSMVWSEDEDDAFAIMEKTKAIIYRANPELSESSPQWFLAEEPIVTSSYISHFSNMEVVAVAMDDVMSQPDSISSEVIQRFESKKLRDFREIVTHGGLAEALLVLTRLISCDLQMENKFESKEKEKGKGERMEITGDL